MDIASLEIQIARSENLPVLPQIVGAVLKLADDPNASSRAMERLVERDPAITAKILRVSNSSYYGLNQVTSIARAISLLGMNSVRSLVIGVAYQQVINSRQQARHFDKLEFWRHSLATATAARIVGRMKNPANTEELYGAAMMHDIGILVMDRFCSAELDQALITATSEGIQMHEAEQLVLGFDHAMVGGMLATKWGLSPLMTNAIRYHHDVTGDADTFETTCLIAAANGIAYRCGFRNNTATCEPSIPGEVLEALNMSEEQLAVIQTVVMGEVEKAETAFSIKSAA